MPAPNRLRNLKITAISLCKQGASEGAHVLVAKHHLTVGGSVTDGIRRFVRSLVAKVTTPAEAEALSPAQLDALAKSLAADEAVAKATRRAMDDAEEDLDDYDEEDEDDEDEEEGDGGEDNGDGADVGKSNSDETPPPEIGMADNKQGAPTPEDVLKSMPAEARGAIEHLITTAVTAGIAKAVADTETKLNAKIEAAEKKAEDLAKSLQTAAATSETATLLKGVPHDPALMTTLLQKATPEEKAAVEQIAKAYRALEDKSTLLAKSIGGRAALKVEDGSPESKLETIAKTIAKEEKVTFEKAYSLAVARNEELYNEIIQRDSIPVRGEA